jgi:hypothetical protein
VLVNRDGATEAVVIGVGGFLGIGEKDVAVPFTALEWVSEPRPTATSTVTPPTGPVPPDTVVPRPAGPGTASVASDTTAPTPAAPGTAAGSVAQGDSAAVAVSRGYPDRAVLRMTGALRWAAFLCAGGCDLGRYDPSSPDGSYPDRTRAADCPLPTNPGEPR